MWIAIVDDDREFVKQFVETVEKMISGDDMLTYYYSGIEFIEAITHAKQQVDALFLDIVMPGFTGISTGYEFRELCPNSSIVMLTEYPEYAIECYEFGATSYILKPLDKRLLAKKIGEIRNKSLARQSNVFEIRTRQHTKRIPLCDVIYVESFGRRVVAHTRCEKYEYTGKISDIENKYRNYGFLRIHKSYIVNVSHIGDIKSTASEKACYMNNGVFLPVSDNKLAGLLFSYVSGNLK